MGARLADDHPVADVPLLRAGGFAVGQHRGAHIGGRLTEHLHGAAGDVIAQLRAFGARDFDAFRGIPLRKFREVVTAEHAGAPTGQHHQTGDRVDQ